MPRSSSSCTAGRSMLVPPMTNAVRVLEVWFCIIKAGFISSPAVNLPSASHDGVSAAVRRQRFAFAETRLQKAFDSTVTLGLRLTEEVPEHPPHAQLVDVAALQD